MNVAVAISSIIKVLLLDRDQRAPVMCHKIHRVVRAPWMCWLELYCKAPACAPGVAVKHAIPVDGAATAVPACVWRFAQYDRSISERRSPNSRICIHQIHLSINGGHDNK